MGWMELYFTVHILAHLTLQCCMISQPDGSPVAANEVKTWHDARLEWCVG